jgi:hypothetical protein
LLSNFVALGLIFSALKFVDKGTSGGKKAKAAPVEEEEDED